MSRQARRSQGAAPGVLGWPTLPLKTPEGSLLLDSNRNPFYWSVQFGSQPHHPFELASLLQPVLGPDFPEPLLIWALRMTSPW